MISECSRWDAEVENNMVEDELGDFTSNKYGKGDYFNPLSEIVSNCVDPLISFR